MTSALLTLFALIEAEHGIPKHLLTSICWVESRHRPLVINMHDGNGHSRGVCQLKLQTARGVGFTGTADELYRPEVNARFAARYLKYQYARYSDWDKAVVAYNQGHYRGRRTQYLRKVQDARKLFVKTAQPTR